jgi:hypothetical protein
MLVLPLASPASQLQELPKRPHRKLPRQVPGRMPQPRNLRLAAGSQSADSNNGEWNTTPTGLTARCGIRPAGGGRPLADFAPGFALRCVCPRMPAIDLRSTLLGGQYSRLIVARLQSLASGLPGKRIKAFQRTTDREVRSIAIIGYLRIKTLLPLSPLNIHCNRKYCCRSCALVMALKLDSLASNQFEVSPSISKGLLK